jgi:hypothetical protein
LKDGTEAKGADLKPGDRVFVYEMAKGRNLTRKNADGTEERLTAGLGKQGIVSLGVATRKLTEDGRPHPDVYDDGSSKWWRWKAETGHHNDDGFVPREEVVEVIGGHQNLMGLNGGSGLKELTVEQYEALLAKFKANSRPAPESQPPAHGYGGGGESDAHKTLKHFVADHPEQALGESGVTLVKEEFQFRTGDRIDVLLKDKEGRPIAVEIELSQGAEQTEGFLQAIKYRAMYRALTNDPIEGGRAMLIAHHLDDEIVDRCRANGVETLIISEDEVVPRQNPTT